MFMSCYGTVDPRRKQTDENASSRMHSRSCTRPFANACRFFASIHESKDGGKTWVRVAGDAAAPMQAFNSAMGQMGVLNGCMLIVGGYSRQASTFSYLNNVWRPSL